MLVPMVGVLILGGLGLACSGSKGYTVTHAVDPLEEEERHGGGSKVSSRRAKRGGGRKFREEEDDDFMGDLD